MSSFKAAEIRTNPARPARVEFKGFGTCYVLSVGM